MYVIRHAPCAAHAAHALSGVCAVGAACGVTAFQVWLRTLAAGEHTPAWRHLGQLAAVVLSGGGKLLVNGAPQRFQAPCTLVVPAGDEFELVNNAAADLELVIVFTVEPQIAAASDPAAAS